MHIYIKLLQERGLATFVHLINEDFYVTKDIFLFFFSPSSGAGSNNYVTKHVIGNSSYSTFLQSTAAPVLLCNRDIIVYVNLD